MDFTVRVFNRLYGQDLQSRGRENTLSTGIAGKARSLFCAQLENGVTSATASYAASLPLVRSRTAGATWLDASGGFVGAGSMPC